jgi:hypothetical protein
VNGPAHVHLHIDRLVLHGVAPGDRAAVLGALQAEITRQLQAPGVAARLAGLPSVPALRPAPRAASVGGEALGRAAATQLVRGLG